jgi:hypothetical protein
MLRLLAVSGFTTIGALERTYGGVSSISRVLVDGSGTVANVPTAPARFPGRARAPAAVAPPWPLCLLHTDFSDGSCAYTTALPKSWKERQPFVVMRHRAPSNVPALIAAHAELVEEHRLEAAASIVPMATLDDVLQGEVRVWRRTVAWRREVGWVTPAELEHLGRNGKRALIEAAKSRLERELGSPV